MKRKLKNASLKFYFSNSFTTTGSFITHLSSSLNLQILDDIFASQMQQLLGNALQEKDLEPPRSVMEVRSMLCKDSANYKDNNYYY